MSEFISFKSGREIEWLELPFLVQVFVTLSNRKAGKKEVAQDCQKFINKLDSIGRFEYEQTDSGIRVYGYK